MRIRNGLIVGLMALAAMAGCPSDRAVHTDTLVKSLSESGGPSHYGVPGEMLDPDLLGKIVLIQAGPGSDIDAESYYPDGQTKFKVQRRASAFVNSIAAAQMGADGQKFAQDELWWQRTQQAYEAGKAAVPWALGQYRDYQATRPQPASQPSGQDQFFSFLKRAKEEGFLVQIGTPGK